MINKKNNIILQFSILMAFLFFTYSQSQADIFNVDMTVNGTVNSQAVDAHATGLMNTATGTYTMDWVFTSIPAGFSVWGSVITKASSPGTCYAVAIAPAVNISMLGADSFSIHEVARFPGGESLLADVTISQSGDTIFSVSTLTGDVNLPPLVGISVPISKWTPGPGLNQFVEKVTKSLIRQDGGPSIPVETEATYTLFNASLPTVQFRKTSLAVLEAVPDMVNPTSAKIQYQSTVMISIVPTLSEWGLIIFSLVLLGSLVWYLRKRKVVSV